MSDLIDIQIRSYPEILRRLAAGERIASAGDDVEKLAATALVVEAIENERAAEHIAPEHSKEAVVPELAAGAALGAVFKEPVRRMLRRARGLPEIPEQNLELLRGFRQIIEAKDEAASARRKTLLALAGGAAAGVVATKVLSKKDEKSSAAPAEAAKAAETPEPVAEKKIETPAEPEGSPVVNARALLDRVMKNFA